MNSTVIHERPGVYSSYDASSAISGGAAKKVIGVAARAAKGEANKTVRLTSYAAGVNAFGEDNESSAMEELLRLLYQNGAAAVAAVAVAAVAGAAAEGCGCRHRNRLLSQRRHRLPPRFQHQLLWSILIIRMQVINRLHPICRLI